MTPNSTINTELTLEHINEIPCLTLNHSVVQLGIALQRGTAINLAA